LHMSQISHTYKTKLIYTTFFSIAMAYLESAVVVYLRLIYYPDGFTFPIVEIPQIVWMIETGREAATIIMLLAVARFLANNSREWFAYFAFNFGVWDIWYYLWLKIFINWPSSFLDWDILFLIPIPWISPVLAPILVSISLITASFYILKYDQLKLNRQEWILEIICGVIIILSFITQTNILAKAEAPETYSWLLFLLGWIPGLLIFAHRLYRCTK